MRAGKLDTRIQIQVQSTTQDESGQPANTWVAFAYRWAGVEPLKGREYLAAGQKQGRVGIRFRMRWFAGLLPSMRILWSLGGEDRICEITDILLIDGQKNEMQVMADWIVGLA